MRDGRMRCAMLCAMVGCDARGNFHRASHPTIAPRIARCDFQRFSSRIASRDAIFSDFHRALHRAMRCAREKHRASHRAMRGARKKTSRLASRDARREGKNIAPRMKKHRAMRGVMFFHSQRVRISTAGVILLTNPLRANDHMAKISHFRLR